MALLEEYHVVADMYPVSATTNPNIVEGMFVGLNSSTGNAVKATTAIRAIGVAGDSTVSVATTDDFKNQGLDEWLVINAAGKKVKTGVRASDPSYDETAASGKITVYNGGGKFHTDIFETKDGATGAGSAQVYAPGDPLYVSDNGKLTKYNAGAYIQVATCVVAPREYPSGVPGTDTTDGSISLGSFLTFILKI